MKTLLAGLMVLLVACSGGAAAPSSPATSPIPSTNPITSPEEAAARVMDVNPSLAGIEPFDPDLIGGCCYWQAEETGDGFEVTFEVGWGDCQAGCIDRHSWLYRVSRDGAVELVTEAGPDVPAGVPGNGGGGTGGGILPGGSGIEGIVLAGPSCPVVTDNDPNCDDRPIAGATVLILDAGGREVARLITDAAGHYAVTLPAGPYIVEPQPVDGFMRAAEPIDVTVGDAYVTVDLAYDTGIR